MKSIKKANKIIYGGDYNPEQWSRDVWEEDMRLFKLAHIDTVTINIFSWARIQKDEKTYDFSELDDIIAKAKENGLKYILATSTAAHPAWMAKKYPEVTRTDFEGRKRKFGARHNSCPNSPIYIKYSRELAKKLAERYSNDEALIAWHINNEYGGICYCENCEKAFREWLKKEYGSIDAVNEAWNTGFWSHTFYDFDEIVAPNMLTEHWEQNATAFQGISLAYKKFMSDSILNNYLNEQEVIKEIDKVNPVTTNFMYMFKDLDYQKWAKEMDFVCWDNYPGFENDYTYMSFNHDLFRTLKDGNPFIIMEQSPSSTNWKPVNPLPRPNVMRLNAYQGIAHGADGSLFFQLRKSRGASEKFHGAVIDHTGTENTRAFREVSQLGSELCKIGDSILDGKINSKVGILINWDNWWAFEYSSGPTYRLQYIESVMDYYRALNHKNIPVDIIGIDSDFSKYDIVIAPTLYMMKTDFDKKVRSYVNDGGTFLTTTLSGIVNEDDLVHLGGYPATIRDILGIWVEEIDDLPKNIENEFTFNGESFPAKIVCDILHLEGADTLGDFKKDFYSGSSAVTVHNFGKGKAYYVGTTSSKEFYSSLIDIITKEKNITPVMTPQTNIEVTIRENENGRFLFIINHNREKSTLKMEYNGINILNDEAVSVGATITLDPKGVEIFKI